MATRKRSEIVRNRRGMSTRATILEAAHRLLKEKGFEALSLDAVARAAGVARSSVYHQFQSRDGLFLQLIAETIRGLQREGRKLPASATAIDRFLSEAEAGFRGDPNLLRMFYLLVFDKSWSRPELRNMLREAYRFRTERLAKSLAKDGRRPGDAEALAVVLIAALDGLYARQLIDLGSARLRRAFALLADFAGTRRAQRR